MAEEPLVQRVPAQLDTLGAIAFAPQLAAALAFGRPVRLDLGGVDKAGIVGLQLLAAATLVGRVTIEGVTPDLARAIRTAGLGELLLGEPAPVTSGEPLRIRFDEAALRFGGEPLERLSALGELGAVVAAELPANPAREILEAPDRLLIAFAAWTDADESAVAEALALDEGGCSIEHGAVAPPPPPAAAAAAEAPSAMVPVAQEKLDAIVWLVGDLIASQAALVEALGSQRSTLALQLTDLERTVGAMQDGILRVATSPLDLLVARLPHGDRATIGAGGIEIDRTMFDRLAPALETHLAAGPLAIQAGEDGGYLVLRVLAAGSLDDLRDRARSLGGRAELVEGGIELRLPRSLSLIEVLILDVGAAVYAVPVSHLIEVLRPGADMLHHIDPTRPVLRYRDRYVPVIALGERFGMTGWEADPQKGVLAVVHAGDTIVAVQADAINDQRQVALKPLGGGLTPPAGIAGAAITGASRIALVLDLAAFEAAA